MTTIKEDLAEEYAAIEGEAYKGMLECPYCKELGSPKMWFGDGYMQVICETCSGSGPRRRKWNTAIRGWNKRCLRFNKLVEKSVLSNTNKTFKIKKEKK